jgi:hypothetical protein
MGLTGVTMLEASMVRVLSGAGLDWAKRWEQAASRRREMPLRGKVLTRGKCGMDGNSYLRMVDGHRCS